MRFASSLCHANQRIRPEIINCKYSGVKWLNNLTARTGRQAPSASQPAVSNGGNVCAARMANSKTSYDNRPRPVIVGSIFEPTIAHIQYDVSIIVVGNPREVASSNGASVTVDYICLTKRKEQDAKSCDSWWVAAKFMQQCKALSDIRIIRVLCGAMLVEQCLRCACESHTFVSGKPLTETRHIKHIGCTAN